MRPTVFAAVGDNCIDRFLPPIGNSLVGGNAVNVAVQLALLGAAVGYFGAVGDDADGRRTVAALARNGVDAAGVRVRPGPTAYTDIAVDEAGDRRMVFEEFGACRGYRPSPADLDRIVAAAHVHIGWLDDGGALRHALARRGVSVSQDVSVNADADDRRVRDLEVAFASAGADLEQARVVATSLHAEGARLAVVTCAELGSLAFDGRRWVRTGIRPVEVVDTTGAGDSFIAGFLTARHRRLDVAACLDAGRDAAAAACAHLGGFPQEPAAFAAPRPARG